MSQSPPDRCEVAMSRWWGGPLLIGVGLGLGACSSESSGGPIVETADSAGYRIVTHDLSLGDPDIYRIVGTHDLEIGVLEGSSQDAFAGIVDLAVDERDWLVISDASAPELRMFDEAGAYQRTIGQRGEGPGEFGSPPTLAGVIGDTIFTFDRRLGRITRFLRGGDLLGTMPVQSGGGGRIMAALRMRDGHYFGVSQWIAPNSEVEIHDVRLLLDSIVVERLDASGQLVDTARLMADRTMLRFVQDAGERGIRTLQAEPPFLPRAFLESNGRLIVSGHSGSFELELGSRSGGTTLLRVLGAKNPADRDALRTWQEEMLRRELGDGPWDPGVRRYELDHLPSQLPAFAAVSISSDGDVWVARSEIDDSNGYDWLVFTSEGRLRGSVHTPPRVRLLAIRRTFIIGVITDALDVPYVRRYPLAVPGEN